jgi:hypothetical protein
MPSFQQTFLAAEGQPIEYEGKKLQLVDYFSIDGAKGLRLQFEKTNSEWRQGVAIDVVGDLIVNEQRIRKSLVLWEDTAPVA